MFAEAVKEPKEKAQSKRRKKGVPALPDGEAASAPVASSSAGVAVPSSPATG